MLTQDENSDIMYKFDIQGEFETHHTLMMKGLMNSI